MRLKNIGIPAFTDATAEREYLERQWEDGKQIIRTLAFIILAHTIFLIVVNLLAGTPSAATYAFLFAVQVPFSLMVVIGSYMKPFSYEYSSWRQHVWFFVISVVSVMVAATTNLRSLLCDYGLETKCSAAERPVGSNEFRVVYIVLGPFLILNTMINDLRYQIPAIMVDIVLSVWAVVMRSNPPMVYPNIVFIVGCQIIAIGMYVLRQRVGRARFLAELDNQKLSRTLQEEVREKTEAQQKAREEESKRNLFTNMVFHDMRVPLNSVVLSINDLEADENFHSGEHDDVLENLARINTGLQSVITILDDTLDFRRLVEGRITIATIPFNYIALINEVIVSMESGWKAKNVTFETSVGNAIGDLDLKLIGDPGRLRQVIANYLSNAIKFTKQGGSITLTTTGKFAGSLVTLYVSVTDTGIGIREEDLGKLFKPFSQINPAESQGGKGSGLGLSICSSIISSMGGKVGVSSKVGVGSTFWFEVPLLLSDIPISENIPSQPTIAAKPKPPGAVLKILVTDDDRATRSIMRKLISRLGHRVEEAVDGIDCIEKIATAAASQDPYDFIFLDNYMPRMDGLDVIKRVRTDGNKSFIISVTGSGDEESKNRLLAAGANLVMLKPVTLSIIKQTLDKGYA